MSTTSAKVTSTENPFPGLRPFKRGEEHYFFGRERQTDAMVDKLSSKRFLAVIGSSGCGKSSLVNCGLHMALRGGQMADAGTHWRIAQCRPAGKPIASLATALAADGVLFSQFDNSAMSLESIIDANLRMSKHGIIDVFEQAHLPEDVNLLIVIDQFEEIFRYEQVGLSDVASHKEDHEKAVAFINLLLAAREQTKHPIYIVLTMRSDFLGDCTQFEGLAEAINEGQYLVPRMNRQERRSAISGPVGVSGAQIDQVLLTRLVNDLGDDPDQLSILQHALNRLWFRREELSDTHQPLNIQHYQAVGSMSRALDLHADSAFAELSEIREQTICEKLFKAITNKATDVRGVRRPTKMSTLCKLTEASIDEVARVIDVFRQPDRSFLMPPFPEPLTANSIIDISHESLMRKWQRLVSWSDEEAASTQIFIRLSETAELHANDQAGLWRDPDLQLALEWRAQNNPNAAWAGQIGHSYEQAMKFLDDSRAAHDIEKEEEIRQAEQAHELERARAITNEQAKRLRAQEKAARKQKEVIALIVGGLIVTSLLLLYAFNQKQYAASQEEIADTQKQALQDEYTNKSVVNEVLQTQTNKLETKTNLANVLVDTVVRFNADNSGLKQSLTDSQQIRKTLWQLLSQNGLADYTTKTEQKFTNDSKINLLILTLNSEGYQTSPTVVDASQSVSIDGYTNQIWVARSLPGGVIVDTGVMSSELSSYVFD